MTNVNSDFEVREYNKNDYLQINKLWSTIGLGGAQRGDNEEVIDTTLLSGGKLYVLVEIMSGNIIGTSWITNDHRRLYLHHFGINKEYQGRWLSKLLIQKSLEYAKSTGLQIKLEVHKDNLVAVNLYKKYFFSYLGDYNVYIIRDLNVIPDNCDF